MNQQQAVKFYMRIKEHERQEQLRRNGSFYWQAVRFVRKIKNTLNKK